MTLKQLLADKKGYSLGDLQGIVLVLVVVGVLFGAGLYVLTEFETKINNADNNLNGTAYAAVGNVSEGMTDLAGWIPIIVIVVAAAVVIGIVIRSFAQGSLS